MRVDNVNLNENLYNKNLAEFLECICGCLYETSEHYLLDCPRFHVEKVTTISRLKDLDPLDTTTLLHGNPSLSDEQNAIIFNNLAPQVRML